MPSSLQDRIAVSTWSLHRHLGTTYPHAIPALVGPVQETYGEGTESLLDLPSALHNHGYSRMELVSFHLPSRDRVYLDELRAQLRTTGVTLQTLLIDAGDLTDPVNGPRDQAWIAAWIETANELGAEYARVVAGMQAPSPATLDRSVAALTALADGNAGSSVRLVIENWHALLPSAKEVTYVLDRADGKVGLLADFGNWQGSSKYDELAKILGRAELCHAKASFVDGDLDAGDYGRCIDLAEAAGYAGPYTLIFDSEVPVNEWDGLAMERDFIVSRASGA